ncbi:unnamed protein product [Cuscuta epithymum]|uniref:Uncharacterized protein n=1 Tax=Cuscuta epithymum TaxID=186058 RepID=A0AAV0C9C6_9ASTE|nr:unnamed protein product [Cuscuta epithymum]
MAGIQGVPVCSEVDKTATNGDRRPDKIWTGSRFGPRRLRPWLLHFPLLLKPVHLASIFFVENPRTVEHMNLFGQIPTDGASVEFNPTRYSKYMYEHSVFTWKPEREKTTGLFRLMSKPSLSH